MTKHSSSSIEAVRRENLAASRLAPPRAASRLSERGQGRSARQRTYVVASYDADDRLVRWLDGKAVTTLEYDTDGVLVRTATRPLSLGEPFETTFQYDTAKRVTEIRVTGTVHRILTTFAYAP